jgi:cytochrome b561
MTAARRSGPAGNRGSGPPAGYSTLQILLHWTIAGLIFIQLFYNEPMQEAFTRRLDREDGLSGGALFHILTGSSILVLACARLFIRLRRGAPPPHDDTPPLLNWIGRATHFALYFLIFALPITGLLAWFGRMEAIAEVHEIGRFVLIPVIGFHIAGAFAEHFVFQNDSVLRMLRPKRRGRDSVPVSSAR